jgi:hypothetical protein
MSERKYTVAVIAKCYFRSRRFAQLPPAKRESYRLFITMFVAEHYDAYLADLKPKDEVTFEVSSRDLSEAAFWAGAALAILDARVRAEVPFAGVWRQRLALKAAAASARIVRRAGNPRPVLDEVMLRDAFYLRHGNDDDPGPAGRILVAWRAL